MSGEVLEEGKVTAYINLLRRVLGPDDIPQDPNKQMELIERTKGVIRARFMVPDQLMFQELLNDEGEHQEQYVPGPFRKYRRLLSRLGVLLH